MDENEQRNQNQSGDPPSDQGEAIQVNSPESAASSDVQAPNRSNEFPAPEQSSEPVADTTTADRQNDVTFTSPTQDTTFASTDTTTETAPTEPNPYPYPTTTQPTFPPKKSRKKLLIGLLIGLLLVLIGSAIAVYALWYQNPQKVVTDAIVNMIKSETMTYQGSGEFTAKSEDEFIEAITVTMDGKNTRTDGLMNVSVSLKSGNTTRDFSGAGLLDKDSNLYIKIDDVAGIINGAFGMLGELPPEVKKVVDSMEGKWVRISADDLGEVDETYKEQQQCLAGVVDKLETDENLMREVSDVYKANQFITIVNELGMRDGNLGYELSGDRESFKGFVAGLKDTTVYRELQACDDEFELDPEDIPEATEDDTSFTFQVWISQFGHELREATLTVDDKESESTISVRPTFNEPVTVEAPAEFIPFNELLDDFNEAFSSQFNTVPETDPFPTTQEQQREFTFDEEFIPSDEFRYRT